MPRGPGKIQKKVLVLLYGGLSLMFAGSYRKRLQVKKAIGKEWEKIDREALYRAIRALYESQLVDFRDRGGGIAELILTRGGNHRVLQYNIDDIKIKRPVRWDGHWRIVSFDIPKEKKRVREAFRSHLRRMGFYQFQKSVFVFPYSCEDEIDFLIEFYDARRYVRQITALDIDNALHLKHVFNLR